MAKQMVLYETYPDYNMIRLLSSKHGEHRPNDIGVKIDFLHSDYTMDLHDLEYKIFKNAHIESITAKTIFNGQKVADSGYSILNKTSSIAQGCSLLSKLATDTKNVYDEEKYADLKPNSKFDSNINSYHLITVKFAGTFGSCMALYQLLNEALATGKIEGSNSNDFKMLLMFHDFSFITTHANSYQKHCQPYLCKPGYPNRKNIRLDSSRKAFEIDFARPYNWDTSLVGPIDSNYPLNMNDIMTIREIDMEATDDDCTYAYAIPANTQQK